MELVNIEFTGPGINPQDVSSQDAGLVSSNFINSQFGNTNDVLELHIYDENGQLLESDYNASDYYSFLNNPKNDTFSNMVLDPEKDLKSRGYNRGVLNIQYNFLNNLFNSSEGAKYWIKEISISRTEIKLASQVLSDSNIKGGFDAYGILTRSRNYFPIFYLNFGDNNFVVANNVAYTQDEQGGYLIVKLYEPLPSEYDIKTQLWMVDRVAESVNFNVNIQVQVEEVEELNKLRGPNYNVNINTKNGQTTPYYNYNDLLVSPVTSSFQKLSSYYQDKALAINVDYSNFSNFIKFSSAVERINNFVYKLQQIETSKSNIASQIAIGSGPIGSLIASETSTAEQQIINNIIENFDTYEYFLYFESSSWAWPKSNSTQPYALYSVTSSQASNFLGTVDTVPTATTQSLLFSASYYDSTNKDILRNTAPQYLLDDPSNQPFVTFLDMIGQHFDNLWIYYKDVSNRFNATNNPNTGISLDLVSDALKGLGLQLYTNTNVSDNLYYTLFGINADGSLLPPTGSEKITSIGGKYVTSSIDTLPVAEIQDEIYKRLYHNLPYLYKTKGTAQSIKSLISIFGIPDSMLTIREYGGNQITDLDGITDLNSSLYKVNIYTGSNGIVTGSSTISSSLLSPYTTVQYYQGNTRLNSSNLEVGFSPSDTINNIITSSLGTFDIDQLIGSPAYRYSSSYESLISASNAHFSNYTYNNSVWEYIRLLKFYNNSLFKSIKDFVPARANVSTGIIVKSHMLERNKYARHEPQLTFNDYSQSIEILEVSADNGGTISGSTFWSGFVVTPLGPASYSSSQNQELYTGEYSGSQITVTDGTAIEQGDYTSHSTGSIELYNYGALYQNVTGSERSRNFIELDYNSNQLVPVNYGIVTYSLNLLNTDAYSAYSNLNNPFAQLQDYNYFLQRSTIPRYEGSEIVSATYNTYTAGDQSYGKTAAIDKIKGQYAYLVDIYSASQFLPGRSNAQIKYIIDNSQNVLDLTKANKNIFEVQNIFRSGETVNISLFDYDESNPYTQQLANDPTLAIYEGGWRYLPVYHNVSKSSTSHQFDLQNPIALQIPVGSTVTPSSPELQVENYSLSWWSVENETEPGCPGTSDYEIYVSASYTGGGNVSTAVTITANVYLPEVGGCSTTPTQITIIIPINKSSGVSTSLLSIPSYTNTCNGDGGSGVSGNHWPPGFNTDCTLAVVSVSAGRGGGGGSTTTTYYTYWTTSVSSSQTCIYYRSQSNEILFNTTMSFYYANNSPIVFSSSSDIDWASSGLPPVILPFSLSPGDKMSLFNSQSLGWSELNEYTIKSGPTYYSRSGSVLVSSSFPTNVTSSVMAFELVESVNVLSFSSGSSVPTESITRTPFRNCRYVFWKRVPDETNVMLRYNPKSSNLVENGILFPQYIDQPVRENAGNVIKSLKQQNLI